jgi:hypothetical protein
MNPARSDSEPWYRYRWPWLLMAGPAAVVVAGILTAWLAASTSDGLVADDYYKQGLAVNRILASNDAAAAMRLEARLRFAEGRIAVELSSRVQAPLPPRLRLTLAHPTRATEDRKLVLVGDNGAYSASVAALSPGRWRVTIEDEAGAWRMDGSVRLPDDAQTVLVATGKR